jgi:hypothetical protein
MQRRLSGCMKQRDEDGAASAQRLHPHLRQQPNSSVGSAAANTPIPLRTFSVGPAAERSNSLNKELAASAQRLQTSPPLSLSLGSSVSAQRLNSPNNNDPIEIPGVPIASAPPFLSTMIEPTPILHPNETPTIESPQIAPSILPMLTILSADSGTPFKTLVKAQEWPNNIQNEALRPPPEPPPSRQSTFPNYRSGNATKQQLAFYV